MHPAPALPPPVSPPPVGSPSTAEPAGFAPRFPLVALGSWLLVTVGLWLSAFLPLAAPPPWLGRFRAVCFGSTPTGLPDASGWVSLVLAPLSILAFLVVVWGRELAVDLGRTSRSRVGAFVLLAAATVPLLGAAGVARRVVQAREASTFSVPEAAEALPVHYPRGDEAAPRLALVDQSGSAIDLGDFRGRPVLVTFAYAHCTTVCPVIVETVRSAAAASALAPAVVVVTLDPWRDTPSTLAALHSRWGLAEVPGSHVLSGSVEEVTAVHEAWGVPLSRDPASGEISHPALSWVVDRSGRLAYTFNAAPPAWIVEALSRIG